jgi:hypothetical protein
MVLEEASWRNVGRHIQMAHVTVKGKHQMSEYVARLEMEEGARILVSAPEGLALLAAHRDECRVGPDEKPSSEDVIRA